ncbi:multidrug and toxin extrusion protein 1 [Chanos chanos]|uniref:Multidrug and toxin extrusion protein n=1 Tax=Chanos chanos TaxID=29144 RepID=A0A6J2VXR8_CHACN|nr:multidrug and toxin extrusion protein 1-like [Chanos chanos]
MDKAGLSDVPGPLTGSGLAVEEMASSSRLFCCACVRRWIPLAYREELYQVLRLTGPLLVSRMLNFLLPFVNTIFCGHLGNAELAGYALASAIINVTTTATGYGLALACDTLISQTFGGKNLKQVGDILQRSILILLLFCLPCWAILINTQSILLLLQQDAEVARTAELYVLAFLPAVPAMFLHQLQVAYLQNQGIILPQMYTAAVANIINVATNYTLIFRMNLGVKGSAAANGISQITLCILLFAYIRWKKLHAKTWEGWSSAALQEWGSFMRLAIPSTLMLCFEWWIYEIGGFLAGMLGEVDLGAQHVLLELGAITYMFPMGVHAAACVRVGNALGAGDTARALITSKVTLAIVGLMAVVQGIILAPTKSVVAYIFTNDVHIVEIVSTSLTLYIFIQFFDALVCVGSGILLGCGKQKIAAVTNLICYYCIGLPLGGSLMFPAGLRIFGLWLGLLVCVTLQACFFITLIFKLNWEKVTEEAVRRAGRNHKVTFVGQNVPNRQLVIDAVVPENMNVSENVSDTGASGQKASNGTKSAGYTPVCAQDEGGAESGKAGVQDEAEEGQCKSQLSITQLVCRRGLTMVAALLILIAGVTVHLFCPLPDVYKQRTALDIGNSTTPATILNSTLS